MSFGWPRHNKISPEKKAEVWRFNRKISLVLAGFFAAQLLIGILLLIYYFAVGYI
jgi:hypothetical protein